MNLLPEGYRPMHPASPDDAADTSPADPGAPARRRPKLASLWRGTKFVLGGPVAALSLAQIAQNGRLIRGLLTDMKRRPAPRRAVQCQLDGTLDRTATAFIYGVSEAELDTRMARRRSQTAVFAYAALTMGCLFLGVWFWRLLGTDGTAQRIVTGLQFAPFCLVFFLGAFQQAHVNWQLRTGRIGSAGDYLRSPDPFLPRR